MRHATENLDKTEIMIDKRRIQNQHEEIVNLSKMTDSEIVLEYSKILSSIYPSLIKLEQHCYDQFDDITESLFFYTVYEAFSTKYELPIAKLETHKYGFSLHCYHKINHILVKPKQLPIIIKSLNGTELEISAEFFDTKEFVFIDFGDTVNFFSGDGDNLNLNAVNFDYSRFAIVDKKNGLTYKDEEQYWMENIKAEFELVLEDYCNEEHESYKMNIYADSTNLENSNEKSKWKFWK